MQPDVLLQFLKDRRSFPLKELLPDPLDLADIQLMLEAANWAPSHGQTEPWRFTVFAGEGRQPLAKAFGEAYRQMTPPEKFDPRGQQAQIDRAWQAPVWISLGMTPAESPKMPEWEELSAVAIAVQNMHLMACSLGLGCKWSSGAVVIHPHVAQMLGLEAPSRLLGFLYVGKPANQPGIANRRPLADKVKWVTG
jgi:nitroreductase